MKKQKKTEVVLKAVDGQDGKRLRRIPTASEETDVSIPSIRKLLELKKITRYKLNSMTYVDTNEIVALMRVDMEAEVTP